MKIFLSLLLFCSGLTAAAQKEKNYTLEINGDTVSLSLDEPLTVKTKNGQTLHIKLKQKELQTYADEVMTFQYPSSFNLSKKDDDDVEQILCMSGGGNGFIIQKYKDLNPENMVDLMLDEITGESKDAGYKETKILTEKKLASGKIISGKQSTLVLDYETNIYSVYPLKIKKGGILIVLLIIDPDDKKEVAALTTLFWKTFETKN